MSIFMRISKLLSYALPISTGLLVNTSATFLSMIFLSNLGKVTLAAGALAMATYLPVVTSVSSIFYGVGILIGNYRGKNSGDSSIGPLVRNAMIIACIIAIPMGILLFNMSSVLLFLKLDPQIVTQTIVYFHYAALALFPTLIAVIISQFFSGIGYPRYTLIVSVISLPFTLALSYSLILGKFGLPKLGLAGISCALFIVQSSLVFILLLIFVSKKSLKKYQIFSRQKPFNINVCKELLNLGLPIGIQHGSELTAMATVACFMGYFGITALAAYQIVTQYAMCFTMISLGISQAGSLLISEVHARGERHLIKDYISAALVLYCILFSFIAGIFSYIPEKLIAIFIDPFDPKNAGTVALATTLFTISSGLLFVDAMRNILTSALRGMCDSKVPMKTSIFCLWCISVPLSVFSGFILQFGPIGLRLGFSGGFIVATIWLSWRLKVKLAKGRLATTQLSEV